MSPTLHSYSFVVKEVHLDVFGHMNNAAYLTRYEDARWDLITANGYGLEKILETGYGPTIVELNLKFMRELRLHDVIAIQTLLLSYERKIGKLLQTMLRDGQTCSTLEMTFGLFSLKERKLVLPTPEWKHALGIGL